MSKRWAKGSTRAWRRARHACLERDSYRCRLRLAGCTTLATHAHHVGAREVTGDGIEHLVAACRTCNLKVGDPTRATPDPTPTPTPWWD